MIPMRFIAKNRHVEPAIGMIREVKCFALELFFIDKIKLKLTIAYNPMLAIKKLYIKVFDKYSPSGRK